MTVDRAAASDTSEVSRPTIDDLEALRGPLTGYCYRMLGSAADTDDAVQESIVRAHGALDRYDSSRAQLTTWVHRIATNVCIDLLRGAQRRWLSDELGPAGGPIGEPMPTAGFVEPMPDTRVVTATDPATIVEQRETVRLAFVAALQILPGRQRAVLVLRDVLQFSATEAAEILDSSVASVTSALQRARAALAADPVSRNDVSFPDDDVQRDLLNRYVAAFEAHDIAALRLLLRDDAVSTMPPFAWWLDGGDAIAEVMAAGDACVGDKLIPVPINGSPGFGQYRLDDDGVHRPFALVLVETAGEHIVRLTTFFGTAGRFEEFGLPETV